MEKNSEKKDYFAFFKKILSIHGAQLAGVVRYVDCSSMEG